MKCDIRKFFANIDHGILKNILSKYIKDKNILWLFSQVIDSFSTNTHFSHGVNMQNDTNSAMAIDVSQKGLPLGNLTSQLLVNIYMNEFDQSIKRELKVKYYIRYADDFVILNSDRSYLENMLPKISYFLGQKLKLNLHPDKVFIKTITSGVDFLGWTHFSYHRILRTTTKRRMLKNIKNNPKPQTIKSYLGLLKHGNTYKLSRKFKVDLF